MWVRASPIILHPRPTRRGQLVYRVEPEHLFQREGHKVNVVGGNLVGGAGAGEIRNVFGFDAERFLQSAPRPARGQVGGSGICGPGINFRKIFIGVQAKKLLLRRRDNRIIHSLKISLVSSIETITCPSRNAQHYHITTRHTQHQHIIAQPGQISPTFAPNPSEGGVCTSYRDSAQICTLGNQPWRVQL